MNEPNEQSESTRSVDTNGVAVRSSDGLGRNPIFVEYYSHAGCDCYKVKLPWPRYAEEKLVLCEVSEGIEQARVVAAMALGEHIGEAIMRPNSDLSGSESAPKNG